MGADATLLGTLLPSLQIHHMKQIIMDSNLEQLLVGTEDNYCCLSNDTN